MSDSQRWMVLAVSLILVGLFYLLEPILFPFLVGMLLAYLWDPVADALEKRGYSRNVSVIIVFSCFFLLLALLVLLLVPMLARQVDSLSAWIPRLLEQIDQWVIPWIQGTLGIESFTMDVDRAKQLLRANWQQGSDLVGQILSQATRSGLALAGWLANLALIPVVTFYLLRDWDLILDRIRAMLPRVLEPRVSRWAMECNEVLGAFLKGQLLVMICLGIVYTLGLWLIGLDLALLLGVLAGTASIVPYMGFIIGIGAAGIAAFMQYHDLLHLALVLGVFGIGQALEGMLLTPLLVGDKIGLHPVAVIFAIMAGGQLFGFTGVLLALPVAAVIMVLLRHLHEGYKSSPLYGTLACADNVANESIPERSTPEQSIQEPSNAEQSHVQQSNREQSALEQRSMESREEPNAQ